MEIIKDAKFRVLEVTPLGARLQGQWADLWSALQAACVMETQGVLEITGYVSGDEYIARYVLEAGAVQGLLAPGEPLSRPPRKGRMSLIREGMRRRTRAQNPLADEIILQPEIGLEDDCGV